MIDLKFFKGPFSFTEAVRPNGETAITLRDANRATIMVAVGLRKIRLADLRAIFEMIVEQSEQGEAK